MHQLTMIYNCNTIYYMEFLPSYTSFINQLYQHKNSIHGMAVSYYFTKNSSMDELYRQKSILNIDDAYLAQKPATLQEFATKGW